MCYTTFVNNPMEIIPTRVQPFKPRKPVFWRCFCALKYKPKYWLEKTFPSSRKASPIIIQ